MPTFALVLGKLKNVAVFLTEVVLEFCRRNLQIWQEKRDRCTERFLSSGYETF